LIKLLISGLYT